MLDDVWGFLKDPVNRLTLGWIGGGVVAVTGAIWAVIKFLAGKGESKPKPSVSADNSSAAVGGDNSGPITIGTRQSGTGKR